MLKLNIERIFPIGLSALGSITAQQAGLKDSLPLKLGEKHERKNY
jgi:hypothetical protein